MAPHRPPPRRPATTLYLHCDIPPGLTLREYRRLRVPQKRRRRRTR